MWFWFPVVNLLLSLRRLCIYLSGPRGDRRWIFKHLLDFWFTRSPWSSRVQSSARAEHCRTRAKSREKAWIKIKLGLRLFSPASEWIISWSVALTAILAWFPWLLQPLFHLGEFSGNCVVMDPSAQLQSALCPKSPVQQSKKSLVGPSCMRHKRL